MIYDISHCDLMKLTCRYDFSSVTTILQTSWLLSSHLLFFSFLSLNIYQNFCQTVNDCIRVGENSNQVGVPILLWGETKTSFNFDIELWVMFSQLVNKGIYKG